jgi:hypothetical protein
MGLFGPSQYEIQKAIENAISPKTRYHTRYCLRAFVYVVSTIKEKMRINSA